MIKINWTLLKAVAMIQDGKKGEEICNTLDCSEFTFLKAQIYLEKIKLIK